MLAYSPVAEQDTCALHVTARGGQGARALAALLADVGQLQGLTALSMRCETDPLKIRRSDEVETATVYFCACPAKSFPTVQVLMCEELLKNDDADLLLVNSPRRFKDGQVRSIDANAIAEALGVPAYLPMLGAAARSAGWTDLSRVKAALQMALEPIAPYWVSPGMRAVEAGFNAIG